MLRRRKPNFIETYRGFASQSRFLCGGRVLHEPTIPFIGAESTFKSILRNVKLFNTNEVPDIKVICKVNNQQWEIISDYEGYLSLEGEAKFSSIKKVQWVEMTYNIPRNNTEFHGEIMVAPESGIGIISDIDDTVLHTSVESPLKILYHTLVKNPFKRQSFEYAKDVFQKWHRDGENPIFYISNSPWNLYTNITQFLDIVGFPKGPLQLRDFGTHMFSSPSFFTNHKKNSIEKILDMFPQMKFILIGDAAEKDPYIYQEIYRQYPARIVNIYIRDVGSPEKLEKIKEEIPYDENSHFVIFKSFEELL